MNLPPLRDYEDRAIDLVVHLINAARQSIGERQNLFQYAQSRDFFTHRRAPMSLANLNPPFPISAMKFLAKAITKYWKLTSTLKYVLRYVKSTTDEVSKYYYFEAIFSQPTPLYPIPQTTASVYFCLENKQTEKWEDRSSPVMYFWLEGSDTSHNVRDVNVCLDWLLAILQMKTKFYKRIEVLGRKKLGLF